MAAPHDERTVNGNGARPRPLGPRPTIGAAAAARQVAEDASALVKAEIALAKAELLGSVRAKALGAGLLAGAGLLGLIAFLGLLLTIGFVLAEVAGMPGWGAALTVSVALIVVAVVLALVGRGKLATEVSIDTTKHNVERDVTVTQNALKQRSGSAQESALKQRSGRKEHSGR